MKNTRNADPLSSHLAGEEIEDSGKAATQRAEALKLVHTHEGLTSIELSEYTDLDRYQLARRLPEIKSIVKGLSRHCKVSKKLAVTWWLR